MFLLYTCGVTKKNAYNITFSLLKIEKVTIKKSNPQPVLYKLKEMVINFDAWLRHTSVCMIYDRTQSENKLLYFFFFLNNILPVRGYSALQWSIDFFSIFSIKLRVAIMHLGDVVS